MPFYKIGIVVADESEFYPFVDIIEKKEKTDTPFKDAVRFFIGKTEVTAILSGIGKVNAASAAMYLVCAGCDAILNFGLSGGLGGVYRGQFVLPEKFIEHDFDLTVFGYKPCEKPGQAYVYSADEGIVSAFEAASKAARSRMAVCGDRFISDEASRDYLIDTFSASSCDMETAAIASVCHITGIPFACVRRISDDASENAQESYGEMNENEGATLGNVFLKCLKSVCAVSGS